MGWVKERKMKELWQKGEDIGGWGVSSAHFQVLLWDTQHQKPRHPRCRTAKELRWVPYLAT